LKRQWTGKDFPSPFGEGRREKGMASKVETVRVHVRGTWSEPEAIIRAKFALRNTDLEFVETDRPKRAYQEWYVIFAPKQTD
jgi:hypothetical protein